MKKKILATILTALICVSAAACGDSSSTNTSSGNAEPSSAASSNTPVADNTSKEESSSLPSSGEVGDYTVAIQDCSFDKDSEGNKVIIINWDFTNNSDEAIMPLVAVQTKAYQDGVELETAILISDNYDAGIAQKQVKPGASLNGCQDAFVLSSDSPVEFEVSPLISLDGPSLAKEFNIE